MSRPRLPRGARGWSLAAAVVVALMLGVSALLGSLAGGPNGPPSSSYATNAEGFAAWAALLARNRHLVAQSQSSLARAPLPAGALLVVLDPNSLLHEEGTRLLRFVRAGGTLLIGGAQPEAFLPALLGREPAWRSEAAADSYVVQSSDALPDVRAVRSAGQGAWRESAGYRTLLGGRGGTALLLERAMGKGRLLLLADSSPLQNRLLGASGNAELALDLAPPPPAPVVFAESLHGFGESRGLTALPGRWQALLAMLLLAFAVWALARGRRLGPPEPAVDQDGPVVPPRSDYVHALALLLRRAGSAEQLARTRAALEERSGSRTPRDRG